MDEFLRIDSKDLIAPNESLVGEIKEFQGRLAELARRRPQEASIKAAQNHAQSVLEIGKQVKQLGKLLIERGHVSEELGRAIEFSGEVIQAQVQASQRLAPSVSEEMSLGTLVFLTQAHVTANQEYTKALRLYLEASKRMVEKHSKRRQFVNSKSRQRLESYG